MFFYKKTVYTVILFLIFTFSVAKGQEVKKLSSSFIDSTSAPLVIYGITFSDSVIYQEGIMYAPAESFLEMTGIKAYLQKIPYELILNGRQASPALLAAGPDRYTGEYIYYLNIIDTLNFVGIYYTVATYGDFVRITVEEKGPAPEVTAQQGTGGTVSGQIVYSFFEGSSVTISQYYLNSARIPQTKLIDTINTGTTGAFTFTGLPPGDYIVEASCYYTREGFVYFDNYTRQYYKTYMIYTPQWTQVITIGGGESINLRFSPETAKVHMEEKLIYLGSPVVPYKN